jgi:beta-lactam-binding protein with PASTA domain
VVGLRLDDAEAKLYSMPLTAEIVWRRARPGEKLGRVTDQKPRAGTLSSWSTVRIFVPRTNNGRVPNVIGMDLDQARRRLANRRLGGLVQTYVDGGSANAIVAQFPRAGRAALRNMTVRLVVARG